MIVLEVSNPREWKDGDVISLKILNISEIRPGVWRIKAEEVPQVMVLGKNAEQPVGLTDDDVNEDS